jgi:hypothetical protein
MEKFFIGILFLILSCAFWYDGANELLDMSDFFIISFITGHIYFASARKNP